MTARQRYHATRRGFLLATGSLAAAVGVAHEAAAQELTPTPACDDQAGARAGERSERPARELYSGRADSSRRIVPLGGAATLQQSEGPFFKPRSPERADSREKGASGRLVDLSGQVLTRRCRPLAGAVLDLWHADDKGIYDAAGFRYRGHVVTGADGTFAFRTIMPAVYTGRTRHYHFKVQAPGSRLLTTQLYFPDEPANRRDPLFRSELLMRVAAAGDGLAARFDFILDIR